MLLIEYSQTGETLLLPHERPRGETTSASTLPADLIRQSASRLRVLAFLYAFIFFMASFLPAILLRQPRVFLTATPLNWAPDVIAILLALTVAVLIQTGRIPLAAIAPTGLVFEVVGSYGIVAAEFTDPMRLNAPGFIGFSWVAVWTLLFTVVVPTRPRRALVAAVASVSSIPVGMAVLTAAGVPTTAARASAGEFFFL